MKRPMMAILRESTLCVLPRSALPAGPLTIVFSDPGIATVGSRFQSLDGKNIVAGEVRFEHQSRARAGQRNKGILRLYAEPESGRLLGAEMCAPAAEHMTHLLAMAVERSLTAAICCACLSTILFWRRVCAPHYVIGRTIARPRRIRPWWL